MEAGQVQVRVIVVKDMVLKIPGILVNGVTGYQGTYNSHAGVRRQVKGSDRHEEAGVVTL